MTHLMTSFCWAVDSAIRSETASNSGSSPVHSFASVVDYALRSSSASEPDLGTSRVPSFGSRVDYVISSSDGERTDVRAEGSSREASSVTGNLVRGFQLFSKAELVAAINNFSLQNKIGGGAAYIGKLLDGREVAIKRVERMISIKSKLAILSRLHHKHLVGLVGFCEEKDETLLVYEYLKNGALYDHLHEKKNVEKGSSVLNDWKMRIKIALDASRCIEYLHNYAVPSIIHRDIKSSNILIDATWTARVSDFGLSMMSPEPDRDHRPMKAAGTVGYIDPEYYGLNVLTAKSDVYGLGVYMKNGALYDHLHEKKNVEKGSSVLNDWKMRIKIALDASRGIEYLHNYAVPSIIHRDIKSSNILIDATWTARVSDFGLSMMSPEPDRDHRPMKAAGTVGYIDPEYYGLNVLTAKSDVYGLGVVLLELLTGKRAIFKYGEDGGRFGTFMSVVDFAVPRILAGELVKILDPRVGPPDVNEAEAVELVAYIALHCVNLEGKDRPTMTDIVNNLERALAI
ncbi:hypothetical protein DEO72_LG6g3313 [Vigna unguiculata]|uniref:non-specific serine/threonine protein kinase n=1 Tax=Vigna unguiculata TaxID=3917 RepID=A0A4D6MDS0_VIGUN|nr:hypothetical protein DEO72_LG6g3313 [Vigna unguiculata]